MFKITPKRLALGILGAVPAAVVTVILKKTFEVWGVFDPLGNAFGGWLKENVSPSQAQWSAALLISLLVYAALVFGAARLFGLKKAVKHATTKSSETKSEWEREWNDRISDRRDFWREGNIAYQRWAENPKPSVALQDVIERASVPYELTLDDGQGFWGLVSGGQLRLSPAQVHLFDFAQFIYTDASWKFGELEGFDDTRMRLSKFWDRWGRETPLDSTIREYGVSNILESSQSELKLLTYLELARARVRSTGSAGKSGLFRLAQKFSSKASANVDNKKSISPLLPMFPRECNNNAKQSLCRRSTSFVPIGQPYKHKITRAAYYMAVENTSDRTIRNVQVRIHETSIPQAAINISCKAEATGTTKVDIQPGHTEFFYLGWAYIDNWMAESLATLPPSEIEAMAADMAAKNFLSMIIINAAPSPPRELLLLKNDGYVLKFAAYGDDVPPWPGELVVNGKNNLEVLVREAAN